MNYSLEHDQQVSLFRWAKLQSQHPELKLMFAIPNGGHRHITVAKRMSSEGCKAGLPDIMLPVARHGFHGLFIEMKREGAKPKSPDAKGPLSNEQIEWIRALKWEGYRVEVCYGFFEAIGVLTDYLNV